MRIESKNVETSFQSTGSKITGATESNTVQINNVAKTPQEVRAPEKKTEPSNENVNEQKGAVLKGKLEEAVSSINEFLSTQHKASKFVFHEGLDKFYVKLVDSETEEVIKEIPPERLLDAFYEMQKLAGMIVDEKI